MKQQKFFVGDVVKRTVHFDDYAPADGSHVTVSWVGFYDGDDDCFLKFKDFRSEKWIADYFTLVERAWQENDGVQMVDETTDIEVQFDYPTNTFVVRVEKEWWENNKGQVKWRIADNYKEEQLDAVCPPESIPPTHVALGEEVVAVNSSSVPFHVISNKGLVTVDVQKKNKYTREIKPNVFVDVYDVLRAFNVTDPCLSHLAKKALCAGLRGHKNRLTDLQDIKASIERAIEMHIEWEK